MEEQFDLEPEDLFDGEALAEFNTRLDAIWLRLVFAHCSWRALQPVRRFPAEALLLHDEQIFFRLVIVNFTSQIALDLVNALSEGQKGELTLPRLANWMIDQCRAEHRNRLRSYLASEGAVAVDECLLSRARAVRDQALAHHDKRVLAAPPRISFEDLEALIRETERLLNALSVGRGLAMNVPEYMAETTRPGEEPRPIDIERFLLAIAARSHLLNRPEQEPEFWEVCLRNGLDVDRVVFNEWRQKIGLPTVLFPSSE